MKRTVALVILITALLNGSSTIAFNQGNQYQSANTGSVVGNVTSATGEAPGSLGPNTGILTSPQNAYTQYAPTLPGFTSPGQVLNPAQFGSSYQNTLAPKFGGLYTNNGLPPTALDSFVQNSMLNGMAFFIYGDEGSGNSQDGFGGLPPLNSFLPMDRINVGITGPNASGLTTGHSSWMPSATGADEFIGPSLGYPNGEWSMSGSGSPYIPPYIPPYTPPTTPPQNVTPAAGISLGMTAKPALPPLPGTPGATPATSGF
jgi:hypothetical protein